MSKFIVVTVGFLLFSCTDWPTKDNQENEANPININIDIDNRLEEASDNESMDVKVDSEKNIVSVRDYGRGIPLGKVIDCVSQINTGAKYNDDVFQFSVGLNGVGTKAVNALSEHFTVKSVRNKESMEATFSKGKLLQKKKLFFQTLFHLPCEYASFTV